MKNTTNKLKIDKNSFSIIWTKSENHATNQKQNFQNYKPCIYPHISIWHFLKLFQLCRTIPHLHPVPSHQPCSYNSYSKYQLNSCDGLGSGWVAVVEMCIVYISSPCTHTYAHTDTLMATQRAVGIVFLFLCNPLGLLLEEFPALSAGSQPESSRRTCVFLPWMGQRGVVHSVLVI